MASKANKYAGNGQLYGKKMPRPRSEAGIVVEGYFSLPGTFERLRETTIRPYINPERAAKKYRRGEVTPQV